MKETRPPRLHDVSDEVAAFRNQQAYIGREHGPGHHRLHCRSPSDGRGADAGEQAGADFRSLGFGSGRGTCFKLTWRQFGQRFL